MIQRIGRFLRMAINPFSGSTSLNLPSTIALLLAGLRFGRITMSIFRFLPVDSIAHYAFLGLRATANASISRLKTQLVASSSNQPAATSEAPDADQTVNCESVGIEGQGVSNKDELSSRYEDRNDHGNAALISDYSNLPSRGKRKHATIPTQPILHRSDSDDSWIDTTDL